MEYTNFFASEKTYPVFTKFLIYFFIISISVILIVLLIKFIKFLLKKYEERFILKFLMKNQNKNAEWEFIQRKRIFELITEFKNSNDTAKIISSSIFFKFSEFFLQNLRKILIIDNWENEGISGYSLLKPNKKIEIDVIKNGRVHTFNANILNVNDKNSMKVKIIGEQVDKIFKINMKLHIKFNTQKFFYSAESKVISNNSNNQLVLTYPGKIHLENERKFTRLPLTDSFGIISDKSHKPNEVQIIDISYDGVAVKSNCKLALKKVYNITFTAKLDGIYTFKNFECMIVNTISETKDCFEYGMNFICLENTQKAELVHFLNDLNKLQKT